MIYGCGFEDDGTPSKGQTQMGETTARSFQLSFNTALKVEFQGSRVTSDGGLILVRELDERLGFSSLIARHVTDPRGKNAQFRLADLIRHRSTAAWRATRT
jgi:hypothetical protein